METTKPRTVNSIGMFDMLKGAGMLAIVLGHTAELYPLQLEGGLSLTAFVGFIYRETLMAAFFIASGYGFRKRSISKCIHQQLKSLLKPFCYTAVFTTVLHFIIHYKTFHYLPGSMTESIKVAGGFLLGLPHTATYFGQEFFSCGPMWYLLALLMGWIVLDVILNIFPERYIPVGGGRCRPAGLGCQPCMGAALLPDPRCGDHAVPVPWLPCQAAALAGSAFVPPDVLHPVGSRSADPGGCLCHPASPTVCPWQSGRLGPISILLDGLAGLLFVRLFLRLKPAPERAGELFRGHRPPLPVHLLHTYRGAYRHSVVSVRGQIRRPPCFGHLPAICPFAGLHLA